MCVGLYGEPRFSFGSGLEAGPKQGRHTQQLGLVQAVQS